MYWLNATVRTGETGRRGPGEGGGPGMGGGAPGGAPASATPLAGNGMSASYTATLEALRP